MNSQTHGQRRTATEDLPWNGQWGGGGGGRGVGVGRGSLTSLIARNLTLNADEAPNYKYILRKQAYSNILKISPPKNESFSDKNSDIFHISA